jgi:PGF-pre-PGF domain-containing protein
MTTSVTFTKTDVSKIEITAKKNLRDVKIEIQKLRSCPPEVPRITGVDFTYGYMRIETVNLEEGDIASAKITFKVSKSWMEEKNIDENLVKLNRYADGKWTVLPTSKISEDTSYIYYSAETPGFSVFAITGEVKAVRLEPTLTPIIPITPKPIGVPITPTPITTPPPSLWEKTEVLGILIIAVSAIFTFLLVFILVRRKT